MLSFKAVMRLFVVLLAFTTADVGAVSWSLVLENKGTAVDAKADRQVLGDTDIPPIVWVTCEPGDKYSLSIENGTEWITVFVGEYISVSRYVAPTGLETAVVYDGGAGGGAAPGQSIPLARADLTCSPIGLQQILVGDLQIDDGQTTIGLTFNIALLPRTEVSVDNYLLKQPDPDPGAHDADMALAVALSHLAYFDNTDNFVTDRLIQAGFFDVAGSLITADVFVGDPGTHAEMMNSLGLEDAPAEPDAIQPQKIGNHAYVALRKDLEGKDVLYVFVRGTSDPLDWLFNLNCVEAYGVHYGFLQYALGVLRYLESDPYAKYLKPENDTRFFLTGHSLGGATSTVLALALRYLHGIPLSQINTVTLGAPRSVGDQLAQLHDSTINHLVLRHLHDPVPQTFERCLSSPLDTYMHLGDLFALVYQGPDRPVLLSETDGDVGGWAEAIGNFQLFGASHHALLIYYNSVIALASPTPPSENTRLNDTGITWGGGFPYDFSSVYTCTSSGTISAPQDCDQGRDAEAARGDLAKVGTGHGGFDFTKLDSLGNELPVEAATWSCVRDNHTGLVWEVKTNDGGIHDKDAVFRWGGATALGDGTFYTYYRDWDTLVEAANAEALCGFTGWRVPSVKELEGIISFPYAYPTIDIAFFSNTTPGSYWTSSPATGYFFETDPGDAWAVLFNSAETMKAHRDSKKRVRLVNPGE